VVPLLDRPNWAGAVIEGGEGVGPPLADALETDRGGEDGRLANWGTGLEFQGVVGKLEALVVDKLVRIEHHPADRLRLPGHARQQLDDNAAHTWRIGPTRDGRHRFGILESDRIGWNVAWMVGKNGELQLAQRDQEVEGAALETRNLQLLKSNVDGELRMTRHLALKSSATRQLTIEN
jgi:hypothetical protein